ncbi:MAG: ABC transporter ATP-binding protein [Chloroflexi bacterium]|nr:ABC transporter ATP-binding protein [Chloroflexota bacterium]
MSNILIHTTNLTKSFGDTLAVDNLSLQVRAGEIYGLIGPDGAGKTTAMRLLCGALRPDSGEILVGGHSMIDNPNQAREQLGYLSQRFSLYEELTVLENLRFFAEVRGLSADEWGPRTMEILEFVGLADFVDRRAGLLSGGMKQKLGLATALVHRPRILLLDEPTGGVDPVTRQDFWRLIIRLVSSSPSPPAPSRSIPGGVLPLGEGSLDRSEGRGEGGDDGRVSVLVSTPYMDEAVRCTYVGFMKDGRLIVEDKPKALRERLAGRIIELHGEPLTILRGLAAADEDVEAVQTFGDRLHLRVREGSSRRVIRRLERAGKSNRAVVTSIEVVHPHLEDVFMALLEE